MPRSRGSELPQRQSPRLRTSISSDSDHHSLHHRRIPDRSLKLNGDRRSPRSSGPITDPLNQRKLGTRISDLESQLGQAQDELRVLKEQLATAEAAKKEAQQELHMIMKKPNLLDESDVSRVESKTNYQNSSRDDVADDTQQETDVFEVPMENVAIEPKVKPSQITNEVKQEDKEHDLLSKQVEKLPFKDPASKEEEINALKAKLYDMEEEHELLGKENESLKKQLNETTSDMSNAEAKEEEMTLELSQMRKELEECKANAYQWKEKLEAVERATEALEAEMKKLRVQTEQWRKAADAAAAVLVDGVKMHSRISERRGSMEKHFADGYVDAMAGSDGYTRFVESPGIADDSDDGFGSGKRKGSGMKMFGELWRKKSQK